MKATPEITPEKLLRLPDVEKLTGLKRSSIYRAVKESTFPAPVKLGRRMSAWPASKVQAWIADRVASSQKKTTA